MKKYFIGVILLIGLQSCKTDNVEDYELKVLDEIFNDLIYKMGVASWFIPPPPPSIIDLHGDTVAYQRNIDDYTKQIKKWGKDTTIVIAVTDTLFTCYKDNYLERQIFTEYGYNEAYKAMTDSLITSRPLDLSKIKNREKIILKYHSEFPKGTQIWKKDYDFFLSGVLTISRIYFDSSRQFGLFYCSFMCGSLCGDGVIVCIHKINDKWAIEKIINLWVS